MAGWRIIRFRREALQVECNIGRLLMANNAPLVSLETQNVVVAVIFLVGTANLASSVAGASLEMVKGILSATE